MEADVRNLTDADIMAVVSALKSVNEHCRYDIAPEEMKEVVRFVKNWNAALERGQTTMWTTILVLVITGLFGLLGLGAWARLKG